MDIKNKTSISKYRGLLKNDYFLEDTSFFSSSGNSCFKTLL
jgi:hypothetical protein